MLESARFRKIFFIRFIGYTFLQLGFLVVVLTAEPVISEELRFRLDQVLNRRYSLPQVVTSAGSEITRPSEVTATEQTSRGFGDIKLTGDNLITPVSTDFGIVIEKINANAKVIANVDPGNEDEYTKALSQGVAHARGTVYPGQKGNIYLFSHSVDAPWNIIRFNAVFYLLNKMEAGDRVIIFYQGRRFDYLVFDKIITKPDDTKYLTNSYNESVLTLQTCDPPGTLLNRLIVRAKLAGG